MRPPVYALLYTSSPEMSTLHRHLCIREKLGNYVVNIKTLEDNTGIDFFCNLPDEIEKEVENVDAEALKKLWGFK